VRFFAEGEVAEGESGEGLGFQRGAGAEALEGLEGGGVISGGEVGLSRGVVGAGEHWIPRAGFGGRDGCDDSGDGGEMR